MAKHELGSKRTCPKCAAKFYDLGRRPARCPKCAHEFDPELVPVRLKVAPEPVDDEEAPAKAKVVEPDGFEDEVDDTPEVGEAGDDIVVDDDDDDDEASGLSDDIPDGFEEDDGEDPVDEDDNTVLLDDDEDDDFAEFTKGEDEDL
ncbi:TIGR02300 family protein [uncultured Maricaulis sp.]|uniref:TIGR02300 family protein n=1 Tax=uncultured Maricaulis sp. TaxID=174710 RepID=UPI0030D78534|tara:strand:+ start:52374 stop:52811 length:438 start_codon:yes stop_codon:yes gene_type:complete